jgi:hypothetical protein
MKNRLIRLGLGASLALVATAPMTQPANAWACIDEVGRALCLVVGTSCRVVDLATGRGEICQLG